jgi:hypothetical protein
MVTSISNSIQGTQSLPSTTRPAPSQPAPSTAKKATPRTDTAQLSAATQALLKELAETPSQTAKEASTGDVQAKQLLAKQASQKSINR